MQNANRKRESGLHAEVLEGLSGPQKSLPCKLFYDAAGSALFDAICETPEYYPTRAELGILKGHAGEIGRRLGPGCQVVEYGTGSGLKTRWLLWGLPRPAAYVPVDIAAEHLSRAAADLAARFPDVPVTPVVADFTGPFAVPDLEPPLVRRAAFFPGSTVGNFAPAEAVRLLARMARLVGRGGALVIGVDLVKDAATLHAAYNDAAGMTAAFNKNLLTRLNRDLGADFELSEFDHRAVWNAELGRIEMYLVSRRSQAVRVGGRAVRFAAGEAIHTENSHKYTPDGFATVAARAGWRVEQVWTDPARLFSVQFAVAERVSGRPEGDG
jgi:dimethylhistidine N-methyltransferase